MANTEHIEAKLCAYVEGELDAAGRAEIEAHLQANPQHRQLLSELMEQRSLLRELPRVKAPLDLNESLQTQLERSVLFDKTEAPYVAGRINRWPPLVLAAVLILSVGLLTIIYFILPDQRNPNYATMTTTAPTESDGIAMIESAEPTTALAAATPAPRDELARAEAAAPSAPPAATVAPTPAPPAPAAPSESLALTDTLRSQHIPEADMVRRSFDKAAETTQPTGGAVADRADIFAKGGPDSFASNMGTSANFFANQLDADTSSRLQNSPTVRDNSALIVVAAKDAAACNRELTSYFAQNSITWEPLSEPMPAPIELKKDDFVASKMPRNPDYGRLSKGGAEMKEKALQDTEAIAQKREASSPPATDAVAVAPAPEPAPTPSQPTEEEQPSIVLTPAPQGALVQQQQEQLGATQPAQQQIEQVAQMPARDAEQHKAAGAQVIVARNLTPAQVEGLFACVDRYSNNETQMAQYNRAAGVVPPDAQVALLNRQRGLSGQMRIEAGPENVLKQQQFNLQMPATQPQQIERQVLDAAKLATTVPANAASSNPSPPNSAPAIAAATPATTQSLQIAGAPATQPPASQPLTPLPVPPQIAEQRLTAGVGAGAIAATRPADAASGVATQPTGPIDVVIVLQPQPAAAPATSAPPSATSTAPATQ